MNGVKTRSASTIAKFIFFSAAGIFFFFINITIGGRTAVPLVQIIDAIRFQLVGTPNMLILVMIFTVLLCISFIISKVGTPENKFVKILKIHHARDNAFSIFCYFSAAVFSTMVIFQVGPAFILDPLVGTTSVRIASDVVATVFVASILVTCLTEYGLLEFIGKLLEPIMRVVFKVPGKAAVDSMSSFVASPAVSVMITNNLYKKGVYTDKEACAITTSVSSCSIGAFAFLSAIAGVGEYFSTIVLTALFLVFFMFAIMVRIPILSWKKDVYIDGTEQTAEMRKPTRYNADTIPSALNDGLDRSENVSFHVFGLALCGGLKFAQKVSAYVVALSVIVLTIANYTPIISFIGEPLVPILNLLGVPDAAAIAPGILLGVFALSLPATLAGAAGVTSAAAFFVVILSSMQVIFFTESANAMMDSEMPLSFIDLIVTFLIRTVILIPVCAIIMHIVF